jgi:hypothetical protein
VRYWRPDGSECAAGDTPAFQRYRSLKPPSPVANISNAFATSKGAAQNERPLALG